jgi:hypothetical protein
LEKKFQSLRGMFRLERDTWRFSNHETGNPRICDYRPLRRA